HHRGANASRLGVIAPSGSRAVGFSGARQQRGFRELVREMPGRLLVLVGRLRQLDQDAVRIPWMEERFLPLLVLEADADEPAAGCLQAFDLVGEVLHAKGEVVDALAAPG